MYYKKILFVLGLCIHTVETKHRAVNIMYLHDCFCDLKFRPRYQAELQFIIFYQLLSHFSYFVAILRLSIRSYEKNKNINSQGSFRVGRAGGLPPSWYGTVLICQSDPDLLFRFPPKQQRNSCSGCRRGYHLTSAPKTCCLMLFQESESARP